MIFFCNGAPVAVICLRERSLYLYAASFCIVTVTLVYFSRFAIIKCVSLNSMNHLLRVHEPSHTETFQMHMPNTDSGPLCTPEHRSSKTQLLLCHPMSSRSNICIGVVFAAGDGPRNLW